MKLVILLILLLLQRPADSREITRLYEMNINSSINPATLSYLQKGFEEANQSLNSVALIKINTPGGLVSTTKEIITLIGKSNTATIVWVFPEGSSATSAGAIISAAAH